MIEVQTFYYLTNLMSTECGKIINTVTATVHTVALATITGVVDNIIHKQ
jgi:hypothetical protein